MNNFLNIGVIEDITVKLFKELFYLPGDDLYEGEDMTRAFTGLPFPLLNFIIKTRLDEKNAPVAVKKTIENLKNKKTPFVWYVTPLSLPVSLPALLEGNGMKLADSQRAMGGVIKNMDLSFKSDTEPDIKKVNDLKDLEDFIFVFKNSFLAPDASADFMFNSIKRKGFHTGVIENYTGYIDGAPVCCSSLAVFGDICWVYNIGVLADFRRRGLGGVMTAHPLIKASEKNIKYTALQAAVISFNLYKKIGFKDLGEVLIYSSV